MDNGSKKSRRGIPVWIFIATLVTCAAVTFGLAALLINIFQRKQEAKNPFVRLVDVDNNTSDPERWRMNWPREYDGYSRSSEMTHTEYGGSETRPTTVALETMSHGSNVCSPAMRSRSISANVAGTRICCMTRKAPNGCSISRSLALV